MIYIVDDSPLLRERLITLLSEIEGVEVIGEAHNASEAIAGIRRLKPQVVILDIQMKGGGSGIEVLKWIKEGAEAPVVMMLTNHSSQQYREKCLGLGADYFLDKSRDFDHLMQICKDLFVQRDLAGSFIS